MNIYTVNFAIKMDDYPYTPVPQYYYINEKDAIKCRDKLIERELKNKDCNDDSGMYWQSIILGKDNKPLITIGIIKVEEEFTNLEIK